MSERTDCRTTIVDMFARWTALSALRSGSSVKSRHDIYPLLRSVDFASVLDPDAPSFSSEAFDAWHRRIVLALAEADSRLGVGWAVKLVNVYLKTACYVGDLGTPALRDVLHPPVDTGLWLGIGRRFRDRADILKDTHHVTRIRDIRTYDGYERIITGCRRAAQALGCRLIEVEQLWEGADSDSLTTGCRRRRAGWELLGRCVGRTPAAPEPGR